MQTLLMLLLYSLVPIDESLQPFSIWVLDLIRTISPLYFDSRKFIIIDTTYFTK